MTVSDWTTMQLHVSRPGPSSEYLPAGILILQDAFGYNSYSLAAAVSWCMSVEYLRATGVLVRC